MTQAELITGIVARKVDMLKKHLADFSDADMLVRPTPAANHTAWQVAHLARLEMVTADLVSPGAKLPVPANIEASKGADAAKSDDASRFPSKQELIDLMEAANQVQLAALKTMTDADLAKPTPDQFKGFAPNIGTLLLMGPLHVGMHVGQIQVIRRKLGKPVLF